MTSVYYRCWDLALLGETAQKIVILLPLFKSQGLHYRWQVLGVLDAYRKYGQCYTTHQCGLLLLLKEELGVGPMNAHTTPWCRLGTCTDTCTVYICMCTQHVYKDKLFSCESESVATPEVHIPIAGAYRVLYHEYTSLVITKLLYS